MLLLFATIIIAQQETDCNNNFMEKEQFFMRANAEIRERAKQAGVCLWQVAAVSGINDGNFSRKLRRELPQEEKQRILEIINRLAQQKQEVV